MVAAAEKAEVQLAVHHQWSLCPRQRKAKEMIKAGAIGEPVYLQSSGKGYYGGYGLMNIGTHILDQVRNFAGTPEWCFAHETVNGRDITAEDIVLGPDGNILNTGLITNLPNSFCVEVPCLADNMGIHPCYVGDLPPPVRRLEPCPERR